MIKQAILIAIPVIATLSGSARTISSTHKKSTSKIWNDTTSISISATQQMLSEIMDAVGLKQNFELKEANVLNIEASVSHRKRYILYNPSFVNQLNVLTKDKWAVMALLAHEAGHHLNGHTIRKSGSQPELELEADQFAGFVLHKLGASLEQAQEVMKYIAKKDDSKTHPGRNSRMLAIETGWNNASKTNDIAANKKTDLISSQSGNTGN